MITLLERLAAEYEDEIVAVKIVVDTLLFFISYTIQREMVFSS